jgi:hypothetical protein
VRAMPADDGDCVGEQPGVACRQLLADVAKTAAAHSSGGCGERLRPVQRPVRTGLVGAEQHGVARRLVLCSGRRPPKAGLVTAFNGHPELGVENEHTPASPPRPTAPIGVASRIRAAVNRAAREGRLLHA